MNYEAWRISYQSSEQAARAAFKAWQAAAEQGVPDEIEVDENDTRDARNFLDGWNACRAAMLVNQKQDKASLKANTIERGEL